MANNYFDVVEAVANYYGRGSDQWAEIVANGVAGENAYNILRQVPGVQVTVSQSGEVLGYALAESQVITPTTVETVGGYVNSNLLPAVAEPVSTTLSVPATTTIAETGEVIATQGVRTATGASVGNVVFGKVVPAVGAVACGISLGKKIDKTLYNANPQFWDSHGLSMVNPDEWKRITAGDNSLGATCINLLLGIKPDKTAQAYVDENFYALSAQYMLQQGVLNNESVKINGELWDGTQKLSYPIENYTSLNIVVNPTYPNGVGYTFPSRPEYNMTRYLGTHTSDVYVLSCAGHNSYLLGLVSKEPFCLDDAKNTPARLVKDGDFQYYCIDSSGGFWSTAPECISIPPNLYNMGRTVNDFAKLCLGGCCQNNYIMEGVTNHPDAIQPITYLSDPDNVNALQLTDDINTTKEKLKAQYPELWDNALINDVVQPDGTVKSYTYIPVPLPAIKSPTDTQPITTTPTQVNPIVNPETIPDIYLQPITNIIGTPPSIPEVPPDTGTGNTPPIIPPTGTANALFSIYNPTESEVKQFGSWMWSSDLLDQIAKMFNDPMQSIISLHKIFGIPHVSGRGNIKVGYLDSGVESNLVDNQYTSVNCGSVNLQEYFGNVFDYDPYTKISLYLPFIGIVPLDVGEVMRSTIEVEYKIDVLTGSCLVNVTVNRDKAGGVLYTYNGNCAVHYPVSSGSYMGIVTGLIGLAGGVAGTVMSGGALAPALMGAGASIGHMKTNVEHSGALSGNCGAMGIKYPYLIITRPQTALAKNFNTIEGYPSNEYVQLSKCTGYTKIIDIHITDIPATGNELDEIQNLLKTGVLL